MLKQFPKLSLFDNGYSGNCLLTSWIPQLPVLTALAYNNLESLSSLRLAIDPHDIECHMVINLACNLTALALDIVDCRQWHQDCAPLHCLPVHLPKLRLLAVCTQKSALCWFANWDLPLLTHLCIHDMRQTGGDIWQTFVRFSSTVSIVEIHCTHTPTPPHLDIATMFPRLNTFVLDHHGGLPVISRPHPGIEQIILHNTWPSLSQPLSSLPLDDNDILPSIISQKASWVNLRRIIDCSLHVTCSSEYRRYTIKFWQERWVDSLESVGVECVDAYGCPVRRLIEPPSNSQ